MLQVRADATYSGGTVDHNPGASIGEQTADIGAAHEVVVALRWYTDVVAASSLEGCDNVPSQEPIPASNQHLCRGPIDFHGKSW
jgi:hypothetical protein